MNHRWDLCRCQTPVLVWTAFSRSSVSALFAHSSLFILTLTCKEDQLPNLWGPVHNADMDLLVQKWLILPRWSQHSIKPGTEPFWAGGPVWLHKFHTHEASPAYKGKWKDLSAVVAFGRNRTASKLNTAYCAEVINWMMLLSRPIAHPPWLPCHLGFAL